MVKSFSYLIVLVGICSILVAPLRGSTISNASPAVNESGRWKTQSISVAVSGSLLKPNPNMKAESDAAGAIGRSLATWAKAAGITFQESVSEKQNVSPTGNQGDGVSLITIAATPENLLLFAKNPHETAATTRVFFDRRGFITEADIVLNPYQQFSTDGTFGTFDLESTLTHEIGHLLGLEHSSVLSATMHDNYGKNGTFGLQNFVPRTLSAIDVSAVRSKYGSDADLLGEECCSAVTGRLTAPNDRPAGGVQVWAEDDEGRLSGETISGPDGKFRLDGLVAGSYKVLAQGTPGRKSFVPVQTVGGVKVETGVDGFVAPKKLVSETTPDFQLEYLGFNGQLSGLALPLSPGRVYTIYVGGRSLDKDSISIAFNSPFLTVLPKTISNIDFGSGISAVSFEVRVDPRTPVGEYTLIGNSDGSGRSAVIGGIAVRNNANPFSNSTLSSE